MLSVTRSNNQSGIALIVVLFLVVIASAAISAMMVHTQNSARLAQRTLMRERAIAMGDGVLEDLFDKWRYYQTQTTDYTEISKGMSWNKLKANINSEKGKNPKLDPAKRSTISPNFALMTVSGTDQYDVFAATPSLVALGANDRPIAESDSEGALGKRMNYLAKVRVSYPVPGRQGTSFVDVSRVFSRGSTSMFKFFLFSTVPVTEVHPGAAMKIFGRVYVQGDLYNASNSLQYRGEVVYTNSMIPGFYAGDTKHKESDLNIATNGFSDNWDVSLPPHVGTQERVFDTTSDQLDPNFLDHTASNNSDSDKNRNNDGYHEMIEEHENGDTDPFRKGEDPSQSERLADNADYIIQINEGNVLSVYVNDGENHFSKANQNSDEYQAIQSAITTDQVMQDAREGGTNPEAGASRAMVLDVSKLVKQSGTNSPATSVLPDTQVGGNQDGIALYIRDTSAGTKVKVGNGKDSVTTKQRSLIITNGAVLPERGMTIATPHAAYVAGDFNTGRLGSEPEQNPPSNNDGSVNDKASTPDLDKLERPGYDRQPAAIAADAINILSNSWDLSKAGEKPAASNTTINAALITGNVPSEGEVNPYSGGVENFPRLHEDWGGKYLTICGTLALMYNSEEATGHWNKAKYGVPNRRWYYDSNFLSRNVPGFRTGTLYEKGRRLVGR